MKASVVREFGGGFHTEEVTLAEPQGREVLVDVKASGLCHSDELAAQTNLGYDVPVVFGHEIGGVVTAVGYEVADIQVGDHVVGCLVQYCGACIKCLSGRVGLCENPGATVRNDEQEPRITDSGGKPLNQGMALGGFAEQALVHENQLARVPKEIPFPQAALLGCGVVTGAGTVLNTANVQAGESVVVIGTGGVGLNAISGAVVAGAAKIIAVDIADDKLEAARRFGANHVINSTTSDPVAEVMKITGQGADTVIDVVGMEGVTGPAFEMLTKGGGLYLAGLLQADNALTLTSFDMLTSQKRVEGVYMGSTTPKRDIPMFAQLYLDGRYNLDELVSSEISIDEINDGYDSLTDPKINRVVITRF